MFEFNPTRHDYGDKTFLGHGIKGSGLAEVDEALDILVRHPATATHLSPADRDSISFRTIRRNHLVQRMAQTFKTTDGDMSAVLSTMVHAPEFNASLKSTPKFKDPVHYVFSAVRLAYDDKVILNTAPIQNWLNRLAKRLFNHETPDGYRDDVGVLERAGSDDAAFRDRAADRFGLCGPVQAGRTEHGRPAGVPADRRTRSTSTDCARPLGSTTLAALDQAISPQDWNTLFLSSPEFMR